MRLLSVILLLLAANHASAALLGRAPLTPGGTDYQAYYDTALNITWLADSNLAASSTFGVGEIRPNGSMEWGTAIAWIAAMNSAMYLGISDWRLPRIEPVNGSSFGYSFSYDGSTDWGYNVGAPGSAYPGHTGSEMAHLHYVTLGNVGSYSSSGAPTGCGNSCLASAGPFSIVESYRYWSGITYDPIPSLAWEFFFFNGAQEFDYKNGTVYGGLAWAVRDGDIALVPIPAAAWLFASALGGLARVRRREPAVTSPVDGHAPRSHDAGRAE
jgi:hypothetical protein